MINQEILESIETILYNAEYTNKVHGYRFYATIRNDGDFDYQYYNETVELIRALYLKLVTEKEKNFLLKNLKSEKITSSSPASQTKIVQLVRIHQDFIFMFLIKINEVNKALKMICDNVTITTTNNNIYQALYEVVMLEPSTFDNSVLNEILSIIDKFSTFVSGLKAYLEAISNNIKVPKKPADYSTVELHSMDTCEQLLKDIKDRVYGVKQERLSASFLEGINFEVNQDQTQLLNSMSEFNFNAKLNETILKIAEMLYSARDQFDFKSCIDLIRVLLNELCISIALEIKNKKNITPSLPIDSMGRARQYFRDNKVNFLTQPEDDFVGQFNAFISDAGVHALQSEREYARISRNLVIELGLFLVEKLKKYLG